MQRHVKAKKEVHRPRLVLFVGTPSSSPAPVAALWFGALAAAGKATTVLACQGDAPVQWSPELLAALTENGLDPRRLAARMATPELLAAADLVVTLSSSRRHTKLAAGTRRREHWTITESDARKLRDTLRARVAMLVFSEGWGRPEDLARSRAADT